MPGILGGRSAPIALFYIAHCTVHAVSIIAQSPASRNRAASDVEAAAADGVDVHRSTVGQRLTAGHGRAGGPE